MNRHFLAIFLALILFFNHTKITQADCSNRTLCDAAPGQCSDTCNGGGPCVIGDWSACTPRNQSGGPPGCCREAPYTPCCSPGGGGGTPPPGGGGGPSCSCFSIVNNCGEVGRDPGGGSCPAGQTDCCERSNPPPPPPPSCSMSVTPNPFTLILGDPTRVFANVNVSNGDVDSVTFSTIPVAPNTSVPFTIAPATDSSGPPFATMVTGTALDPDPSRNVGIIRGRASVSGPGGSATCAASTSVRLVPPIAWWQAKGAPVTTNGNLSSQIATGCQLPVCNPMMIIDSPATASYGGLTYDFAASTTSFGTASSRNWLTRTIQSIKTYDYAFIKSVIGTDILINNLGNTINNGDINSGTESQGYYWYKSTGNTTINSNLVVPANRKLVLLVEGDLTINGSIRFADSNGHNFFLIVAGRDSAGNGGNIIIDPSVGGGTPTISAVLLADEQIRTSIGNTPVHLYGAAAAQNGFVMERDLVAGNVTQPAEYFEYDNKIPLLYPPQLSRDFVVWREVAP